MFGHDHECQQVVAMSVDRPVQRFAEQPTYYIVRQQRKPLVTGECQFMDVAWFVVVTYPLAVGAI